MPQYLLVILFMCNLHNNSTHHVLPQFIPNDYLFETHKDKGPEKWKIFAWAVRDAISKYSGKEKLDGTSIMDRVAYD